RPHPRGGRHRDPALADPHLRRAHPGAATALGVTFVQGMAGALARLPTPVALRVGRRLGDLTSLAVPRRRSVVVKNIAQAFPELSEGARQRLARQSWQHIGMTIVELARVLARPLQATLDEMTIEGQEHIQQAMTEHGAALMLTAHLGN